MQDEFEHTPGEQLRLAVLGGGNRSFQRPNRGLVDAAKNNNRVCDRCAEDGLVQAPAEPRIKLPLGSWKLYCSDEFHLHGLGFASR